MNQELFTAVDHYLDNLFAPPDEVLEAALRDSTAADLPEISVSPNQGQLLHTLALLCRAQKILEIGTLGGYSAIWLARALSAGGRLITLEYDPTHAEVARTNIDRAGLANQVEVRVGSALETLPQLEAEGLGPFDMVFIDADKAPYVDYLEWSLRLTRPGSLIVADNVIRDGAVIDPDSTDPNVIGVQRFNTALAAEPRVTATALQTVGAKGYDGLALAVVR